MFGKVINLCTRIATRNNPPINLVPRRTLDGVLPVAVSGKLNLNYYSSNVNRSVESAASEKQIKVIKAELTHMKEEGSQVADIEDITPKEWTTLLSMGSMRRRKHYYTLYRNHWEVKNQKIKKEISREMGKNRKLERYEEWNTNEHINYGIGKNTLFMRIYPQSVKRLRNNKIWRSRIHDNSQLIFDCGYEDEMTPFEVQNLVKQLKISFANNRYHSTPFFFNFTNLRPNGRIHSELIKDIPTLHSKTFPIRVTEQFIPDDIAKERLVYLSPNSNNLLTSFNAEDVYIVGAIVDKGPKKPLSLAKAKALGIRTARLPLERFVKWKTSNKILTVDQMTQIMLEFKKSGDMRRAIEHVPTRKRHEENDKRYDG